MCDLKKHMFIGIQSVYMVPNYEEILKFQVSEASIWLRSKYICVRRLEALSLTRYNHVEIIDPCMLSSCQTCRGLGSQMICCKLCTAQGKIYKFICVYNRYHMQVNCMYQLVVNRMTLALLVINFKSHTLFSQTFQPGGFTLHMTGYAPACTKSIEKGSF